MTDDYLMFENYEDIDKARKIFYEYKPLIDELGLMEQAKKVIQNSKSAHTLDEGLSLILTESARNQLSGILAQSD